MNNLLLSLLRAALWNTQVDIGDTAPAPEEWAEVYRLARFHTVQGVLFDVVRDLPAGAGVPRSLAAQWLVEVDGIENSFRKHKALVEAQDRFWKKNGIDAVLIKGLSVAAMYRVPEHRVLGDIDWCMPGRDNWRRSCELVRDKGYRTTLDSDGDCNYVVDGIVVEHHRKGLPEQGVIGELLMLCEHILHHAMVTGIGLRHICDMAVAYSHYCGRYSMDEYVLALRRHGLYRWTALLNEVLKNMAGIPAEVLPVIPDSSLVRSGDVELFNELVLSDGNFGLDKERRFSGFCRRARLFMRYAPGKFACRWAGLLAGRASR